MKNRITLTRKLVSTLTLARSWDEFSLGSVLRSLWDSIYIYIYIYMYVYPLTNERQPNVPIPIHMPKGPKFFKAENLLKSPYTKR